MNQDIPRRIRIDLFTPEEKALFDMVGEIEKLGAHPLLTDVVVLLGDARGKLSDWVDLQAAEQSVQSDEVLGCPSCRTGLCPDDNGGYIPCTICGNTVQPKSALHR